MTCYMKELANTKYLVLNFLTDNSVLIFHLTFYSTRLNLIKSYAIIKFYFVIVHCFKNAEAPDSYKCQQN